MMMIIPRHLISLLTTCLIFVFVLGEIKSDFDNSDNQISASVIIIGAPQSGAELFLHNFLIWASLAYCLHPTSEDAHFSTESKFICRSNTLKRRVAIMTFRELFDQRNLSSLIHYRTRFIVTLREPIDRLIRIYEKKIESCQTRINLDCDRNRVPSMREYFTQHTHHFHDGRYLDDLNRFKEEFNPMHVTVVNMHSVAADPQAAFSHIAKYLYILVLPPFSLTTPLLVPSAHDSISCSDYKHFKSRYDFYNYGLDFFVNNRMSYNAYTFMPFDPLFDLESLCGNFSLSEFNSSFVGPPHVMLIGTNKAGTTTLYSLLVKYNAFHTSLYNKEPCFFDNNDNFNDPIFHQYISDYYSLLTSPRDRAIDASPSYFSSEIALQRMVALYDREELARKKYILLLREPIAKVFSFYKQRYDICSSKFLNGTEDGTGTCNRDVKDEYRDTFSAYIKRAKNEYGVEAGLYKQHLLRWLAVIPRRQIFIVNMEQLYGENNVAVVNAILDFAGSRLPIDRPDAENVPHMNNAETHCEIGCHEEDLIMTCADRAYLSTLYAENNVGMVNLINSGDRDPSEPVFLQFTEATTCN